MGPGYLPQCTHLLRTGTSSPHARQLSQQFGPRRNANPRSQRGNPRAANVAERGWRRGACGVATPKAGRTPFVVPTSGAGRTVTCGGADHSIGKSLTGSGRRSPPSDCKEARARPSLRHCSKRGSARANATAVRIAEPRNRYHSTFCAPARALCPRRGSDPNSKGVLFTCRKLGPYLRRSADVRWNRPLSRRRFGRRTQPTTRRIVFGCVALGGVLLPGVVLRKYGLCRGRSAQLLASGKAG